MNYDKKSSYPDLTQQYTHAYQINNSSEKKTLITSIFLSVESQAQK